MTEPHFDVLVHPPQHLRVLSMLTAVPEVEFAALRDALGVLDPSLSKYLKVLREAGYVALSKPAIGGRRRTWVRVTPEGRAAFLGHLAAIQQLAPPAAAVRGAV